MKYVKKLTAVDAVQYQYTDESIREIQEFLGTSARLWYGCDRHIGAVAWGSILSNDEAGSVSTKFYAGDYLVKIDGNLLIIPKVQFESQFDKIDI